MSMVKLMIRQLTAEADTNEPYAAALRQQFVDLGIKLVDEVAKPGDPKKKFSEQLKASRLQRTQHLTIVENCELFLDIFKEHSNRPDDYKEAVCCTLHHHILTCS